MGGQSRSSIHSFMARSIDMAGIDSAEVRRCNAKSRLAATAMVHITVTACYVPRAPIFIDLLRSRGAGI